jgi:hypothetical protein
VPTLVFYISGHGFGHASRQVEILNVLGATRPDLTLHLRTSVSPDLLARTLRVPYRLTPVECDVGIVQSTSLSHDDEATVRKTMAFHATLADRADQEARGLDSDVVAIVGDIPALAFEVASRLNVPSIAIGNFTWDWIYETYAHLPTAAPWLVPRIRDAYRHATLALELPFGAGFDVFPAHRQIPLIARRPTRSREDTRHQFALPLDRPAALVSFGGYGLPSLDLSALDCLAAWTIVTTDLSTAASSTPPEHVVRLNEREFFESGFRYEDLVAAVDVVVTKPGYGIIAECIAGGTAMLYTSRGQFREYDLLVEHLPRYVRARFIHQEDLFGGAWTHALADVVALPPPPETLSTDGAEVAAAAVLDVISRGSS